MRPLGVTISANRSFILDPLNVLRPIVEHFAIGMIAYRRCGIRKVAPLAPSLPGGAGAIAYASQVSRQSSRAQRSTKWCAADPGPIPRNCRWDSAIQQLTQGYVGP